MLYVLGGFALLSGFLMLVYLFVNADPARLARQLCAQHVGVDGTLSIIALTAKWEQAFAESIVGQGDDRSLAMQPSKLTEFINLVREKFEQAAQEGEAPVLVTSPAIRPARITPMRSQRPSSSGISEEMTMTPFPCPASSLMMP